MQTVIVVWARRPTAWIGLRAGRKRVGVSADPWAGSGPGERCRWVRRTGPLRRDRPAVAGGAVRRGQACIHRGTAHANVSWGFVLSRCGKAFFEAGPWVTGNSNV